VASALQAIRLLKQQSHWSEALAIAKQAVHLLPLINNRSLSCRTNRMWHQDLLDLPQMPVHFLQAGDDAFEALELVELGRGVIMGLLIDDQAIFQN
jgi:hypothetical protein